MRERLIEIATTANPVTAASAANSAETNVAQSGVRGTSNLATSLLPATRGEGERRRSLLAHVPGMTEGIAPRLRPDGESVRHAAHRNRLHRAVVGVEGVDGAVIAAR
jgi:hypothetical protein